MRAPAPRARSCNRQVAPDGLSRQDVLDPSKPHRAEPRERGSDRLAGKIRRNAEPCEESRLVGIESGRGKPLSARSFRATKERGSTVLIPSSTVDSLNVPGVIGLTSAASPRCGGRIAPASVIMDIGRLRRKYAPPQSAAT